MAKAKGQRGRDVARSVTVSRVARLYRLITLLAKDALPRLVILRRLRLNQRGFYRDIELLRAVGIVVEPHEGRYHLEPSLTDALNRLPFPDPQLTLGEAQRLARGRSAAHRTLQVRVDQVTG
jgi:hypothetical protein